MPEPTVWKVLVVEDRAGISASLLRSRPDFEVVVAHRLQAVERLFRDQQNPPFQVLLLDLSLADLADPQGIDAYRRVRAMAPGIPIVVMANAGADEAALALAAEGATACLPRQVTTLEVIAWTLRQAVLRGQVEARRYRDLFDTVPIGILLAAGRRVAMANPVALEILGYARDDLARLSVLDFFPPEMRSSLESALDACVAGEAREATFTASLRRKDGMPVQARVFMRGAILNDAPALALYLAVTGASTGLEAPAPEDVSESVAATETPTALLPLPGVSDAAAAGPVGAKAASATDKMEALGRLAGGIAHDFNNLFTAINGYSEHLLTLPASSGTMARGLKAIRKAGEAAAVMTRGLMAFSHPGTGDMRTVKVDAAVDEVAPMLSSLLGGTLELRIRPGAARAATRLEPGQFEQILLNLCSNAKEAMPQGGSISLATEIVELVGPSEFTHLAPRCDGPYVVLSVKDTGNGMTPDILRRLFEPYFSTKIGFKGSGYGLASIYGIVSQAGGGISVTSSPGLGSQFRIWLPRTEVEAGTGRVADAAPAPDVDGSREDAGTPQVEVPGGGPAAESREDRASVLVVDDEPSLREMLRAVLERYGYEVHEAVSGGDAEDFLTAADRLPDLMVSDVLLRDGLGTDILARLRHARPGLRALFISGHSIETLADQGIRIPPEDFLEKPFTPSQLALKVRSALAAPVRPSR